MSEQSAELQPPQSEVSEPAKNDRPTQSLAVPEHLLYKNRLQEYAQRSALPLPIYRTNNEGVQHAPRFRSTVLVDGSHYTSPNTFSNRKAAEQDAAKVALDDIAKKLKDEGCPLIHEHTIFCKSILNEYLVKMNLEKPIYNTIQPEGLVPAFVSSLVFNGVTYTGGAGRSKKEAEQLAARAVILAILGNSDSGTVMSQIVKSKFKLYAAWQKVKDSQNTRGIGPFTINAGTSLGYPLCTGEDAEVTGGDNNITLTSETCSGQLNNTPAMQQPFHEFKKPKLEPSSQEITPSIVFVPAAQEHLLTSVGSSASKKRNRRSKKKAKNKGQVEPQLHAVVPLSQVHPCSVAQ